MPLTAKQQRFVAEYLIDLNATQAAIRAGYSQHTAYSQGHDLLKKPEIASLVSQGGQQLVESAAGSAEWIVQQAVEVIQRCLAANRPAAAVPALALLARRHPEFSDKHDIKVEERSASLQIIASMPLERLKELAAGLEDEDI